MADISHGESELTLFSRFSRAFSHVVRGDLSVITNEVSYLATQMPSEELERVRNRSSQMAATVSKIAGLQSDVSPSLLEVAHAARIFGAVLTQPSESQLVALDRVKVERLASSLREMFKSSDTTWTAQCSNEESLVLSLRVPSHLGSGARYASWSSFASRELGERSVIDAVVADLIMRAHGWGLLIDSSEHGLECSMFIPLVSENQRELKCA